MRASAARTFANSTAGFTINAASLNKKDWFKTNILHSNIYAFEVDRSIRHYQLVKALNTENICFEVSWLKTFPQFREHDAFNEPLRFITHLHT